MVDVMSEAGISSVTSAVSSSFSATAQAVIYIVMIGTLLALLFIVWYMMSFKHRVRVRKSVRGRTVVIDDKAKTFKDRGGTTWWKLFKHRVKLPAPPAECIDITMKGKLVAEFFLTEDESFIPIEVDFDYKNFKKDNDDSFKPFPTTQRTLLINELAESNKYLKKTLQDLITSAIPYIAVILILTVFMLFFGEVVEPTRDFAVQMTVVGEKMNENLMLMQDIVLERERYQSQGVQVRDDVVPAKSSLLPPD